MAGTYNRTYKELTIAYYKVPAMHHAAKQKLLGNLARNQLPDSLAVQQKLCSDHEIYYCLRSTLEK